MHKQDAEHGAHLRHAVEADRHAKAAEFHKSNGDTAEHARSANLERWTRERHAHALRAVAFIDTLGLSHEVTPSTITYNDALNFVSKVLHEQQQGVTRSLYTRSHYHVKDANDGSHVDEVRLNAAPDFAQEVIDHLGLTNPEHITSCKVLFGTNG